MRSISSTANWARATAFYAGIFLTFAAVVVPVYLSAQDAEVQSYNYTVSTDIKINGSDGPVVLNSEKSYTYSWSSNNATACTLNSPSGVSGISLSGNSGSITPDHPWYPSTGSVTLTLDCLNDGSTDANSVTVSIAPDEL